MPGKLFRVQINIVEIVCACFTAILYREHGSPLSMWAHMCHWLNINLSSKIKYININQKEGNSNCYSGSLVFQLESPDFWRAISREFPPSESLLSDYYKCWLSPLQSLERCYLKCMPRFQACLDRTVNNWITWLTA